ncbi:MAG: FKBP-type peptidyl-prolyl cis-trans isomerase [Phycisphaerales bacterium]
MRRLDRINLIVAALLLTGCDNRVNVAIKPTPVKIIAEDAGRGRSVQHGDLATISYRLMLPNGKELLHDPEFKFLVDSKQPIVIQGINDTVIGMRVGGTRTIDCPPRLHWGRTGSGDGKIPPNTNLIIRIKLLALE